MSDANDLEIASSLRSAGRRGGRLRRFFTRAGREPAAPGAGRSGAPPAPGRGYRRRRGAGAVGGGGGDPARLRPQPTSLGGAATTAPAPTFRPYLVALAGAAGTEVRAAGSRRVFSPGARGMAGARQPGRWDHDRARGPGAPLGGRRRERFGAPPRRRPVAGRRHTGPRYTPARADRRRRADGGRDAVRGRRVRRCGSPRPRARAPTRRRVGYPGRRGTPLAGTAPAVEPLDGATADALDAQHAAPAPQAGAVMIAVTGEPAGADIWHDGRRVGVTPAWIGCRRAPSSPWSLLAAPGRSWWCRRRAPPWPTGSRPPTRRRRRTKARTLSRCAPRP